MKIYVINVLKFVTFDFLIFFLNLELLKSVLDTLVNMTYIYKILTLSLIISPLFFTHLFSTSFTTQ